MATIKQYTMRLWGAQKVVTQKLGADITWGAVDVRAAALTSDVLLAGLIKILVDKGLITDQDLTTVYSAIANSNFPQLPVNAPSSMDGIPVPDPDLGV